MLTKDGKPPHKAITKAYRSALWMYDLAGGARIGHRHQSLDATAAATLAPGIRPGAIGSAFIYWDAWADDARLTLTLAKTAVLGFGAAAANHAPVDALLTDNRGRARGARLRDGREVRSKVVINATGVWADALHGAAQSIRPAKGVHIVVPADRFRVTSAVVLPVPGDRRSIFAIPWAGRTYIGTTDTDYTGSLDDPSCTAEDVEYLLKAVNAVSVDPLDPADVVGRWAGLRPLLQGEKKERTADLSRRHTVTTDQAGVVTVTGGKLTTYRAMAADALDAAARVLGKGIGRCPTRRLKLWGQNSTPSPPVGPDEDLWSHLVGRFGSDAGRVHSLCMDNPRLAEPLVPDLPYLRAEAVWAAREEMARDANDVLERRTRAALLDEGGAAAAVADVERLLSSTEPQAT
jgi:glycerol-3-phosphate dehydrogenase